MRLGLDSKAREYLRVETKLPVRFQFIGQTTHEGPGLDQVHEGWTRDISGGGVCLIGPLPEASWVPDLLTQGLELALSIELSASSFAYAVARVIWLEGEGDESTFGLAFTHISKSTQSRLVDLAMGEAVASR